MKNKIVKQIVLELDHDLFIQFENDCKNSKRSMRKQIEWIIELYLKEKTMFDKKIIKK